jgi:hypothetical protein
MVEHTARSLGADHNDLTVGWHLAVRVAVAATLLMVAVAYALKHFFHVSDVVLVVLTAIVGIAIGRSLPAAQPPLPRWIDELTDCLD